MEVQKEVPIRVTLARADQHFAGKMGQVQQAMVTSPRDQKITHRPAQSYKARKYLKEGEDFKGAKNFLLGKKLPSVRVEQREKHLENGGGGTEELMGCEVCVRTQKFCSISSALRKGH